MSTFKYAREVPVPEQQTSLSALGSVLLAGLYYIVK